MNEADNELNNSRQRYTRTCKDAAIASFYLSTESKSSNKKPVMHSKCKTSRKAEVVAKDCMSPIIISRDYKIEEEEISSESESDYSEEFEVSSFEEEISEEEMPIKRSHRKKALTARRRTDLFQNKAPQNPITEITVSENLPCREQEYLRLYQNLSNSIYNELSRCIFVVGMPGTGKTATVSAVLDCLEQTESNIPSFHRISINGLHVTEPREIYRLLYKKLTNQTVSSARAMSALENEIMRKSPTKKSIVILIDEIDQLLTRKEEVLYKLFSWTQMSESRLVIVAIGNTMDLPERLHQKKVTSRSGLTRYIFEAYTNDEG